MLENLSRKALVGLRSTEVLSQLNRIRLKTEEALS